MAEPKRIPINSPNGFQLNDGRKIPENRVVRIYGASTNENEDILGVPMFFNGELSLKASSKFGSLWDAEGCNLLTLLSGSTNGAIPVGQFAMQGTQIWQSTEPLRFDMDVTIQMLSSGLNDVVKPTLALMSMCLPTKSKALEFKLGSANLKLQTLIPPGPNLQSIIKNSGFIEGGGQMFNDWLNQGSRGVYTVKIGKNITIPKVIVTEVTPTFSKWNDEYGHPISADISIGFSTMEIATTDMIANLYEQVKQSGLVNTNGQ